MTEKFLRWVIEHLGFYTVYEDRRRVHFEKVKNNPKRYHDVVLEYSRGYQRFLVQSCEGTNGDYLEVNWLERMLFNRLARKLGYRYVSGH